MPEEVDDPAFRNEDSGENPSPNFSHEQFLTWRSPRIGKRNPERMNNPVWEWLVRTRKNAFMANEQFNGPDSTDAGPCWCFERFGQSSTQLEDGRTVLIGGEHEDYYDADFCIYNDVIIRHPDGKIDILGYPKEIFPPTDSHSATLVGNRIILIGNLGYQDNRRPGVTPVFEVNVDTFAISPVTTSGQSPGWIHEHSAELSHDGSAIVITGGKLDDGNSLVENIDDWLLHLAELRWERLRKRDWQRWEVKRADNKPNSLWLIQQALWSRASGLEDMFRREMDQLAKHWHLRPDLDVADRLYSPNVPHELMPRDESDYEVFPISVDGVVVRYMQNNISIQVTIEGQLPRETTDAIISDLEAKMSALENTRCESRQISE